MLTFKRTSKSRLSGQWSDDDYGVFDGERHVGRIMWTHAAPEDRRSTPAESIRSNFCCFALHCLSLDGIHLGASAGCRDIRKLAEQLNGAGLTAPSGRPFSFGTLRRVLIRQAELHLGQGPRTQSVAGNQRPSRPYRFRPAKPMRLSSSAWEEFRRFEAWQRQEE
jgi:hypothetical protein